MKILAIGAHADDIELGCGGALLHWKRLGHEISIFIVTDSAYQNPEGKPIRTREQASLEAYEAASYIGAQLIIGDFETFYVDFNEELNAELLRVIKDTQPDLILTHWDGDTHTDHRAIALSTLHTCRNVPSLLMYTSNWYLSAQTFDPRIYVDVTDELDRKIELINIFRSENERTQGQWITHCKDQAAFYGKRIGVKYAEAFQVVKHKIRF